MKKLPLLVLCTCVSVLVGLGLPWFVFFWQDRALEAQVFEYEAPQITLDAEADLFQRLELAAGSDRLIPLSNPSPRRTADQALDLALEALELLEVQGMSLFAPDRWTLQSAETFLLTGETHCLIYMEEDTWTTVVDSTKQAALVWECRLISQKGEELGLLVDDDLGAVLSFAYQSSPREETDDLIRVALPEDTALAMSGFCRDYYQVEFLAPLAVSDQTWLLPLLSGSSETYHLTLSATSSSLYFNSPQNL